MENLFTPWRRAYIAGAPEPGCFFCAASLNPDEPERLVVETTPHHLVMLNRHPYSSGHLMVAPREHLASPQESGPGARAEFWPLVLHVQRVLASAYSPDGFNLGMNLGRPAGAGVPDHYHFHLVPRWSGDTNFMSSIALVRLIPEDLLEARARLRALFDQARQEEIPGIPEIREKEEKSGGNR